MNTQLTIFQTLWLNPVHPSVFQTYYVVENKVETKDQDNNIKFNTGFEGKITGLEVAIERKLDPIKFIRTPLKTNPTDQVKL